MKTIAFKLSMPNCGSWNGKWSGEDRLHVIVKTLTNQIADKVLEQSSYYYNFGDGWGASISVEQIDGKTSRTLKRKSVGFCGYDWMVSSIIRNGKIITEK